MASSSLALTSVEGGPFHLLYQSVKTAIGKSSKFRIRLMNLKSKLEIIIANNVQSGSVVITPDLVEKVVGGTRLIEDLSRLGKCDIHVWGNFCNCLKPNYADRLDELDTSLSSLLDILKLEHFRNVTLLLVQLDEVRKQQSEIPKKLQEIQASGVRVEQQVLQRIQENGLHRERNGDVGGAAPAPALGEAFGKLVGGVVKVKVKNFIFKRLLGQLKSSLDYLKPLIEEIAKHNNVFHLPKPQVENLISEMEKGIELVGKCSKVGKWANSKKYEYADKLLTLDACLQKRFIELKGQVEMIVKEVTDSLNSIQAVIKQIEEGREVQNGEIQSEPPTPAVGLDALLNVQEATDVIKGTLVDIEEEVKSSDERVIPPSSPPPFRKLTYDVFLSFRGEDTRKNFTDHLYSALKQRGIFTFRDDEELERGESIAPNLLQAIEESTYAVVILSQNYANSSCCLDEIAKIVECMQARGQVVLPVFYDVDPSEVRNQTGDYFGKAFAKHEQAFKDEPDKVQRWRCALFQVANLSGWHLRDGYECIVIDEIVQKILTDLNQEISISMEGFVGMDSHLNKMFSFLDIGRPDVRIIGICGMGGIGKTTIAELVYERVKGRFENHCFLGDVRNLVTEKQGVIHLQEKLLSNLLECNVNVQYTRMEKDMIWHRLSTQKVLIILDDVDREEQLEKLCDCKCFGPGSRIILTSRNDGFLRTFGAHEVYKVNPLSDAEALQLFSMNAFEKDQLVGEVVLKLSKEVLKYANGLPLAIKVLGSSFKGRSVEVWSSALKRLKTNPPEQIVDVLKISFEGLKGTEKKIFLDIACFFKGHDIDCVTRILQGCDGHCPNIDIEVLIEKSMVTLFGRKLWMHDLIQTMGREIVRQEYPEEPEKRSRLWVPKEIIHVLDRSKGTSAIESILLQGPTKDDHVHSINDSFSNMDTLRLLSIWNVKFSGNIKYLSNELQYFEWHKCPLDSFPSDFQPDNLVELLMYSSRIKQLWMGEKGWRMLRRIDLSGSQYLMSTPDFTEVPDLETLVLQDCTSLVDVHPSLGFLKKLKSLNMGNCKSVERIPPFTSLEALETLDLSLCSRLKRLLEIEGNMKSLLELHLEGTSIEELPLAVEHLTGLTTLNLTGCKNLLHLSSTIQCLACLKSLNLTDCSKLDEIPENLKCAESLEQLHIGGTAIRFTSFLVRMKNLKSLSCQGCKGYAPRSLLLPASLSSLTSLIELDLSYCNLKDGDIPEDLSSLISLRVLDLSGNCFVRLPESFCQLSKLSTLYLRNCRQLELVPKKLPSSLQYVHAQDCTSLTDYPNQIKVLTSAQLGVTTINSLDSSALGDSQSFRRWSFATNGGGSSELRLIHKHVEEKRVDRLSLPSPVYLKELLSLSVPIFSVLPDNEIPEWFSTISTRNPISIPTDDNKWKGVATCAVISVKGHTTLSIIEPDNEFSNYLYQITLETDVVGLKPYVIDWKVELRPLGSSSHLLMIYYSPSLQFTELGGLNQSALVTARFETNNPFMVVRKCGIRLLYEEDAGWYFTRICPGVSLIYLNEDESATVLESGWVSLVDKRLNWEKFIPPSQEEYSTLVLRKNIESVIPRYLEALNRSTATYNFNLSGSPAWFDKVVCFVDKIPAGSWCPMPIDIPQNLHDRKKWMGFAIHASIAEEVGHIIAEEEDEYRVYFKLTPGSKSHKTVSRKLEHVRSSEEHHQLLVVYIPRAQIPEAMFTETSTNDWHISVMIDSPHVKFRTCGVRVVYKEDTQGFADTIIRCMQKEDSLEFYDKLVVEDWIELIRVQDGHLEGMYTPKERDSRTRQNKKFELLSQKYRNWDWSAPIPVRCDFMGAEISKWKWFMHFKEGHSSEIQLPPKLFDDGNWLGIAVCAFNRLSHEDPSMSVGSTSPDSEYFVLTCRLDTDVPSDGLFDLTFQVPFRNLKPTEFAYDMTWFLYLPRGGKCINKFWRRCNLARVTFSSSRPCLGVHSCALCLVYKEDVEQLVQTLTSCNLP